MPAVVASLQFSRVGVPFCQHCGLLFRNKLGGFHHINFIIAGSAQPDFPFQISMFITVRQTIIMSAVGGEPANFFPQVSMAEIASAGDYLFICHGIRLIIKFSGNIFHISVELHFDFLLPAGRGMVSVIGHLF